MALNISVIVCAHNEVRYLPACVHAVLAQTRPPDEFLIIDNASTGSWVPTAAGAEAGDA